MNVVITNTCSILKKSALNESMLAHISSVKNNHKTPPTIPGWDAEMDYAREESLYWHNIWIQCDRPNSGIIYDIMKKCRSVYHYMLRSLKKKREKNIKVAISKDSLNTNQGTYWKKVECVRKNNFNTTSVIDGHIGDAEIANHFQDKFRNLYNSVPTMFLSKLILIYICIRLDSNVNLTQKMNLMKSLQILNIYL